MKKAEHHVPQELIERAVQVIAATPNCTMHDLTAAFGKATSTMQRITAAAHQAGLVAPVRVSNRRVEWVPVARLPVEEAAAVERAADVRRERNARAALKAAQEQHGAGHDTSAELDGNPIRLRVAVDAPLRFVCTAPNSVFDLGRRAALD